MGRGWILPRKDPVAVLHTLKREDQANTSFVAVPNRSGQISGLGSWTAERELLPDIRGFGDPVRSPVILAVPVQSGHPARSTMDDGHSNLLLALEAASQAARKAWNLPQNHHRCPNPPSNDEDHDISSREATPAVHYAEPQLQLTFDDLPKNSQTGFVFGSDRQRCDVWLGERKHGFSAQLFSISPTDPRGVVFKDLWEGETTVVYRGETPLPRRHFTWILFREWPDIEISMTKQGFNFSFRVRWPDHPKGSDEKAEYETARVVPATTSEPHACTHSTISHRASLLRTTTYVSTWTKTRPGWLRDSAQSHRCEHGFTLRC